MEKTEWKPENLTLYRVAYEHDSGAFQGVLVAASSPEQARTLGLPHVEHGDQEERVHVRESGVTGGPARVLSKRSDDWIYRSAGWAEDADEDGPCSTSCEHCGLHPYDSLPESSVCVGCDLCLGCARDSGPDAPCIECGEPRASMGQGSQVEPWEGPFTEEMAREIEWPGTDEGQRALSAQLQQMIDRSQNSDTTD